jgi:DnaK suppressor protein
MSVQPSKPVTPYKPKKGEVYMNPKQLDHFRAILNNIKLGLGEDIDRTVHTMQDEATVFADPSDRERKLIKKIEEMLAKIDGGDYGFCDNCGVEIGLNRLEARPTATLCIDCKTLDEIREKQVAR